MKKDELKKHILITYEDKKYRVLHVEEKVLVIDCIKKTMPIWKSFDELSCFELVNEEIDNNGAESLDATSKKIAYQRYNIISPILPFVADEEMRSLIIKRVAETNSLSLQTVRKYLCAYLCENDVLALAPNQKKEKRELTIDEKNMRKTLNKYFFTTKKRSLQDCYTLMLKNYYCDSKGALLEEYPSFYQFRYFYRNYKKVSTEMISRNTLSYYQRNQRPLIGDGVQRYAGTIGMGMLDATVCDVYLVNEAGELVGRPLLTFCVDAYSGVICGYSLSWEGGIYSLRNLMLNVISDKVEHCKKYGIEITEEQWPSHKLPLKLVTDQGSEYKGSNFGQITDLGVELINLQSYRAELKGPVEKSFDVIQGYYSSFLKGKGFVESDFQERGTHDYRKDACLTLEDFEKIIIHCIIFYNSNRVMDNFRMTEEMIEQEVKPIPSHIWKWAKGNIGENFIEMDEDMLMKVLLPRVEGRFTRFGLKVNGLHYRNNLYREAYLEGKEILCAYNPDNSNYVYVIENGSYICFELIEERFRDKNLDRVGEIKSKQRALVKMEQEQKQQAKIDLARHIQLITDGADNSGNISTKNIRETRKKEQVKKHRHLMREAGRNE